MKYTLTITEDHLHSLREALLHEDGKERPAILLCGRSLVKNDVWDGGPEERFLSRTVITIPEEEIISNSEVHVKWGTDTFRKALKIAEQENLAVCLVHNHPNGALKFSDIDNENEPHLIRAIYNRNGGDRPHLSIVLTPDGNIFGRAWSMQIKPYPFDMIRIIGNRFTFHYEGKYAEAPREVFQRQQLAFGQTLGNDLAKLKIAVVGAGATGTATASLLSKIGVGHVLLIDKDQVERSNLSRLHGATAADADAGKFKVDVLQNYIAGAGIGTRVRTFKGWVGAPECRDMIKACDMVFGCTDDHSGRIFLNRLAHFYLMPVFDMGIVIEPDPSDLSNLLALQGRLTVIFPGNICLLCRGEVNPTLAAEEDLKRSDPMGYERRKDEAYVVGAGNPSPAVITFTTEIATVSVNELLNRITGFKKTGAANNFMRYFDRCEDGKPGAKQRTGCPICFEKIYSGLGDISPFMDQAN
jgi:molybdopterin/thiamine biosynthesis adenylyltransferase